MKTISPPAIDSSAYYDEVVTRKQRGASKTGMRRAGSVIKAAYGKYATATPDLHTLKAMGIKRRLKAALHDTYTNQQESLIAALKKGLSASERSECPYCRIGAMHTLDHVLPKGKFPEFSIFHLNLVPCCGHCNGHKGEDLAGNDGTRLFINSYHDALPAEDSFLECSVEVRDGLPAMEFAVTHPDGMNEQTYAVLHNHFEKLLLGSRYIERADGILESSIRGAQQRLADGSSLEDVQETFAEEAERCELKHGPNYWETSLYRALALCNANVFTVGLR